jgi:hypothetical protein
MIWLNFFRSQFNNTGILTVFQVSSGVLFLLSGIKCDQDSLGVLIFIRVKSYLSIHGLFSFFEELGLDQCFHPGMFHLFLKFFIVYDFGQAGKASLPAFLSANALPDHWRNLFLKLTFYFLVSECW